MFTTREQTIIAKAAAEAVVTGKPVTITLAGPITITKEP